MVKEKKMFKLLAREKKFKYLLMQDFWNFFFVEESGSIENFSERHHFLLNEGIKLQIYGDSSYKLKFNVLKRCIEERNFCGVILIEKQGLLCLKKMMFLNNLVKNKIKVFVYFVNERKIEVVDKFWLEKQAILWCVFKCYSFWFRYLDRARKRTKYYLGSVIERTKYYLGSVIGRTKYYLGSVIGRTKYYLGSVIGRTKYYLGSVIGRTKCYFSNVKIRIMDYLIVSRKNVKSYFNEKKKQVKCFLIEKKKRFFYKVLEVYQFFPPFLDINFAFKLSNNKCIFKSLCTCGGYLVETSDVSNEYQIESNFIFTESFEHFEINILLDVIFGEIAIGLIDCYENKWIDTFVFKKGFYVENINFKLRKVKKVKLIFSTCEKAKKTKFVINDIKGKLIKTNYFSKECYRYDIKANLRECHKLLKTQKKEKEIFKNSKVKDNFRKTAFYLRLDYWANMECGGSVGHTYYVIKELAKKTEKLKCFFAANFNLMKKTSIDFVILEKDVRRCDEESLLKVNEGYYFYLLSEFRKNKPSYIYERICLGSIVGVQLAMYFKIPYIVEYNGSEIAMAKSFANTTYKNEKIFERIEEIAFSYASVINVVSEVVKANLIKRGVFADKILVNPNGVNLEEYATNEIFIRENRKKHKLEKFKNIIGFTSTFGGWHGIDDLVKIIPKVFERCPDVGWLIIGDGNYRYLLDQMIDQYKLSDNVFMLGRLPQKEGAHMLKMCDIFVSPHNSHMVNSVFFGSPTKIFEYMSLGGGIVASNLEQIGQVLSPAISPDVFDRDISNVKITDEVSVLCEPGNIDEFVKGIVGLVENPELIKSLGKNARQAAIKYFSWEKHIERLESFIQEKKVENVLKDVEIRFDKKSDEFFNTNDMLFFENKVEI